MSMKLTTIAEQLTALLNQVEQADNVPNQTKRDMVIFIDRVVEVVEQAYRDVFRLAVELKFIPNHELTKEGIAKYQRDAERLRERDKYRDVEFICGRLHVLRRQFHEEGFDKLTAGFERSFRELIYLIDDREGELIRIASDFMYFVFEGLQSIQRSISNTSEARHLRDDLAAQIESRIPEMRSSLEELHVIHNRILPTMGGEGLMELLSRDLRAKKISIDASRHIRVEGDIVGRDKIAPGRDYVRVGRDAMIGREEKIDNVSEAREILLAAVKDFPPDRREIVQRQVDEVFDAIERKSPQSEIEKKAKSLEMFLESGKELLSSPAKSAWKFVKQLVIHSPK
jgi:hypothetical protein